MSFWSHMGAMLPSILGFGSSVGAAGLSLHGVREMNAANQKMARDQMSFQERMSSTAYQRTMADMEAAGLNPMLAANMGGASSPSGSTAQMQNEYGGAVSSALDAQRAYAEVKNMQQQNQKLRADTRLSNAMRQVTVEEAKVKGATAKSLSTQLPGLETEQEIDESNYGKFMRYLGRLNPFGETATGLLKAIK